MADIAFEDEEDDFDNSVRYESNIDGGVVEKAQSSRPGVRLDSGYYAGIPTTRKQLQKLNERSASAQQAGIKTYSNIRDDVSDDSSEDLNVSNEESSEDKSDIEDSGSVDSVDSDDLLSKATSIFGGDGGSSGKRKRLPEEEEDSESADTSAEESDSNKQDFSSLLHISADEEMKNAQRTLAQKRDWATLVQMRITLTKALSLINQLPEPNTTAFNLLTSPAAQSPALAAALTRARDAARTLTAMFIHLGEGFAANAQPPVTLKPLNITAEDADSAQDHTHGASSSSKDEEDDGDEAAPHAPIAVSALPTATKALLAKEADDRQRCRPWLLRTADEYHTRANLARSMAPGLLGGRKGKNNSQITLLRSLNQPISAQLASITQHKERLLVRLHMNRQGTHPIGTPAPARTGATPGTSLDREQMKMRRVDKYIVDDIDLYQALLRSLVRSSSLPLASAPPPPKKRRRSGDDDEEEEEEEEGGVGALPVPTGSAYLSSIDLARAQQSLQATQKMQHRVQQSTINRHATKGREMRYTVHPQLVSFMAPKEWVFPRNTDAVMKSLFSG